jgi:hypothetical protein
MHFAMDRLEPKFALYLINERASAVNGVGPAQGTGYLLSLPSRFGNISVAIRIIINRPMTAPPIWDARTWSGGIRLDAESLMRHNGAN